MLRENLAIRTCPQIINFLHAARCRAAGQVPRTTDGAIVYACQVGAYNMNLIFSADRDVELYYAT